MAARTAEGGDVVDGRLRPLTEAKPAAASSSVASSTPDSSSTSDKSSGRSGFSFSKAQQSTAGAAAEQQKVSCGSDNRVPNTLCIIGGLQWVQVLRVHSMTIT
jgi:hypothetical protein